MSLHHLPAGVQAVHAHRLLRRGADQRVRPGRGVLTAVQAAAAGAAPAHQQAHRSEPLHPQIRRSTHLGAQDARGGQHRPAPRRVHEAGLDADRATALGRVRRRAVGRRTAPRLRTEQTGRRGCGARGRSDAAKASDRI